MLDTISLFDNLEIDHTQHRVASRRALALAHNRVEKNLGSFLRAAQTEEEFLERLALVQEDFSGYITTASEEVGHEHPEHIAAALKDHYRPAEHEGAKVEFVETPDEEQEKEEEEQEKTAASKIACGCGACDGGNCKCGSDCGDCNCHKSSRRWANVKVIEGKQGSPLVPKQAAQDPYDAQDPLGHWDIDQHEFFDENGHASPLAEDPIRNEQGYVRRGIPKGVGDLDEGFETLPQWVDPSLQPGEISQRQHGVGQDHGLSIAPTLPPVWPGQKAPIRQGSNEHEEVTCPECGGDGKTAGATKCGKCKGAGKVPNFGDSLLDAYFGRTAEDHGNTDLGGPEPKMDKRKWTPSAPGEPKIDDGKRWPTERKDPTEVIGPMRNDHKLKEIGEKATESVSLPTQKGDEPFSTGGEDKGPHTKTFGDKGQTDPVTKETISKADDVHKNPLVELLASEWPSEQAVQAAFLKS